MSKADYGLAYFLAGMCLVALYAILRVLREILALLEATL